ncbi:MAG: type II toxin-antitoxin system prevent-host-death family antitoxin [Treponema sp.]|nr:type II toxin-antitoxin system prevent-host-death family antitoxin [Treponema sp.]
MEISTKQLRVQPGRIITQVNKGLDVTITYRGKACAKIIPINKTEIISTDDTENDLFGIWKNRNDLENVEQYVRDMRKGRKF